MFDDCIDLILWGHEHDCRITPEPVPEKPYSICQPGSTVATSLSKGEELPKHVGILLIQGKEWAIEPIPLKTVRPFVWRDMSLADEIDELGLDAQVDKAVINRVLRRKVNALIQEAEERWRASWGEQGPPPGEKMMLPLIRLKVDYSGFEVSNSIRFGQDFAGKVANPKDILQFYKRRVMTKSGMSISIHRTSHSSRIADGKKDTSTEVPQEFVDQYSLPSEKLSKIRMSKLVSEYLHAQKLEVLAENGFEDAVSGFVDKDDKTAISQSVRLSKAMSVG